MQSSYTASRCMQKIHQLQVVCREEHVGGAHPIVCREEHVGGAHPIVCREEHVGGAHPKKIKKRKSRADELGSGMYS